MYNEQEIYYIKNDIKACVDLYRIKLRDLITNEEYIVIKGIVYEPLNLSDTMLNRYVNSYSFNKNKHILTVVLEEE